MAADPTAPPAVAPAACEICGRTPRPDDRFCGGCGALLPGSPRPPVAPLPPPLPSRSPGPGSPLAKLSVAIVVVLAAALFLAPFFFPARQSRLQEALISSPSPYPTTSAALPMPQSTPSPQRPRAQFVTLSPAEIAQATRELQTLLGPLYYPGATVPAETVLRMGRTFREGDRRRPSLYSSVALEPPDADAEATLETVTAYYERLLPQGRRLPEGGFRADDVPRPGDGVRTRVFVFRARQPAGRVRVMLMTFR